MSVHDHTLADPRTHPGGATVGDLRAMEGPQALAVMVLRDWFDGEEGRLRVARTFAEALSPERAAAAIEGWIDFGALLSDGTRRPVMRHAVTCRCVGADEAVVAEVLALAARGEREDAMLVLSLLVSGERLLLACDVAQRAGMAVMEVAARWRREDRGEVRPAARHLH